MPARKLPIEFGEWRPDIALLDTKFASEVENVFAGANSYLPFPSLEPFSGSPLSGASGNDSFTKVLLHFDGADAATVITDSNIGGSAHVWTAAGNAQIDTAQTKFGTASLLLDGTGDWVSMPDHADLTFGANDFTIDFWFYCNDPVGVVRHLAGQCDSANTPGSTSFYILRLTNGTIQATMVIGGSDTLNCVSTTQYSNTINPGWHHLAYVRTGSNFLLFLDGVQEGFAQLNGALTNSTNQLRVGAQGENTANTWKGWIEEFRISIGVARWTDTFVPPAAAYISAGGTPCGLYSARTLSGEWKIFAGTTRKLWMYGITGWTDVSRTVGGAYNVQLGDLWMFEQSGQKLVAVNINDDPQVIDIDTGTNFAALAGSPPRATNVKQIGDFLFLSGLADNVGYNRRSIIWSAINDITGWTPGTNLCDTQQMPDGGPVMGVAGGEIGYVLQDRAVRTLQFLPGDTTLIFSFSRVLDDRGCVSKYGFDTVGNALYFVSEDGFYSMTGQQVTPIGQDKVNEWFLANSDPGRRNVVHCIAGVNKPRVAWVYHASDASPMYDRQIIFDWSNSRWARAIISAWVWALLASTGLDLDTPPTGGGDDEWLDSDAPSLDSFGYIGGRPLIGAINPGGLLSALTGPNLPATMETAEVHLSPGMRSFVSDAYPLDDVRDDASGTVAAGTRERLQNAPVWEPPVMIEITGSAALYSSARLHRFRRHIPAASTWTHAQGVVIEAQQDGSVA